MRHSLAVLVLLASPSLLQADTFSYTDESGDKTVTARLVAEEQGALVLELPDGQYRIIPQTAVKDRKPGDDPKPATPDEVALGLEEKFGKDLFRSHQQEPYVFGLVLSAPIAKNLETRSKNFLRRAATFMKNVDTAFGSFAKEARLPVRNPTHPLVVLIFESDDDFNKYATEVTGGRGLSAGAISGFYSGLTNYLAIRLGECNTFDVPLHEAIHQQVYNRNVFHRLSPVPHWFDEGIATGFEANEGKINIGPTKISPRYARLALAAQVLDWPTLMSDDRVFAGDVLAGEAYGHAWSLHWLLVSKYKTEYGKYVRKLAEKTALQKDSPEQRQTDFQDAFGKSVEEMQKEFQAWFDAGIKRQKVDINPVKPPGYSLTQQGNGEVQLSAISVNGSAPEFKGSLKNISPIRPLTYHVTVETDSGTYAEWLVSNLEIAKTATLAAKFPDRRMPNAPGGRSRGFRVRIRSTHPTSPDAEAWNSGKLPVPVYRE